MASEKKASKDSEEIKALRRHLVMVYGQARAVQTLAAAILANMSLEQRATIGAVLKGYVAESISLRELPSAMADPADAQAYRNVYSATLQAIIEMGDELAKKEVVAAAEEAIEVIESLKKDEPST